MSSMMCPPPRSSSVLVQVKPKSVSTAFCIALNVGVNSLANGMMTKHVPGVNSSRKVAKNVLGYMVVFATSDTDPVREPNAPVQRRPLQPVLRRPLSPSQVLQYRVHVLFEHAFETL